MKITHKFVALFAVAVLLVGLTVFVSFGLFQQTAQDLPARPGAYYQLQMTELRGASLLALLTALALAYLLYRELTPRLSSLAQIKTEHQLKEQKNVNAELNQINAALAISEDKLAVTLRSIGDAVIATDAEGRVVLVNPVAEKLSGWTNAEASGRLVDEILHLINQETRQPSVVPVFKTLAHGTVQALANHTILVARDGSECSIADSCAPIRSQSGQVVGTVLVFRDVTAEESVRQALRDQQFYTRSLIESNIDALITIDPAGLITDVNKQTEALTGRAREELLGTPFSNYFTDAERAQAALQLTLSEHRTTNYELTARAKTGTKTVVSYNAATIFNRKGKLQGVFAAARDITEREHLYEMLQEKNVELERTQLEAETANHAKSNFLSNMSHELRTPLNAILGFAQLIESGSPPPTVVQKRNIDHILKAGWYLLELINEILDLALIESGKVLLSLEPVSLPEVLLECRAMVEPQAQKRGITMHFPQCAYPCFVNVDRTRVKQILINLLFNAIKYNKPQGTVAMEFIQKSPELLRICISDTGAGLSPAQIAQLFQPFNRLGKEASAEEGTGIGLMVTKRLVEMMGGTIGVQSTVGVGSMFWVELNLATAPLLVGDVAGIENAMHAPVAGGAPKRTLLYVEDNPANLELVVQIIERRPDLRLLTAADGELGIEYARTYQPEVILMDIHLPGISGIEAMRALRSDPLTAHIPIIALSANAVPREIEKAMEAGFLSYLTKPIKVYELLHALDQALEISQPASAGIAEQKKEEYA